MLFLAGSIVFTTWLTVSFKIIQRLKIDSFQSIVTNYFVCIITGITFGNTLESGKEILQFPWWPWAIVLGFCFISFFNLTAITVRVSGLTVAGVATKISLVIPFLFAVFFLNERAGIIKWIGVGLAMIAVVLTSLPTNPTINNRTNRKILPWLAPIILFLGTGFQDAVIKWTEWKYVLPEHLNLFLVACFIVAFLVGFGVLLILLRLQKMLFQPKALIAGVIIGVPNYFSIWFLIKALKIYPTDSSVIIPVNNVAILLLNVVVGYFVFKEKLSFLNLLGIILSVVAIVLISSNFI